MTDQATEQSGSVEDRLAAYFGAEQEEPVPQAEEEQPEVSAEQPEAEEAEGTPEPEEAEAPEEEIDFEWNGEQYKLPKALKEIADRGLRLSDYTRKTQEVAEERKAVAQMKEALQTQVQSLQSLQPEFAQVAALKNQVAQYEQLDWARLARDDPQEYLALHAQYQAAQRTATQAEQSLGQKQQALQQQWTTHLNQMARNVHERATKELKLDEAANKALLREAQDRGFIEAADQLQFRTDYRMVRLLHDAMKYRSLQAAQPTVAKKVSAAPKVLKPGPAKTAHQVNAARVDQLSKVFRKSGDLQSGAALLIEKGLV